MLTPFTWYWVPGKYFKLPLPITFFLLTCKISILPNSDDWPRGDFWSDVEEAFKQQIHHRIFPRRIKKFSIGGKGYNPWENKGLLPFNSLLSLLYFWKWRQSYSENCSPYYIFPILTWIKLSATSITICQYMSVRMCVVGCLPLHLHPISTWFHYLLFYL